MHAAKPAGEPTRGRNMRELPAGVTRAQQSKEQTVMPNHSDRIIRLHWLAL
jgi:hypothetical protein